MCCLPEYIVHKKILARRIPHSRILLHHNHISILERLRSAAFCPAEPWERAWLRGCVSRASYLGRGHPGARAAAPMAAQAVLPAWEGEVAGDTWHDSCPLCTYRQTLVDIRSRTDQSPWTPLYIWRTRYG